jgi:hypothetical protein
MASSYAAENSSKPPPTILRPQNAPSTPENKIQVPFVMSRALTGFVNGMLGYHQKIPQFWSE